MGVSRESYLSMLLKLAPHGLAWMKQQGTTFREFLYGMSEELFRVDARADVLLREIDPRTTTEMLEDWERVLGLPDECSEGLDSSIDERRRQVLAKLTSSGSINRQFYIDLAAFLGFTITVYEFRPFRVGMSSVGDPLSNGDWVFVWRVDAPLNTVQYFKVGGNSAGDPLAQWSNDILECYIDKRKPAGTRVIFSYA